jgi:hypothetical protein
MRKKILTICEVCGGTTPSSAADFIVFHCLAFCSPDCHDDYRAADDERRTQKQASRSGEQAKAGRAPAA